MNAGTEVYPSPRTLIRVWAALVALTGALLGLSYLGPQAATWGMVFLSTTQIGLALYYFMNLGGERTVIKVVVFVAFLILLTFLSMMFADVALRGGGE